MSNLMQPSTSDRGSIHNLQPRDVGQLVEMTRQSLRDATKKVKDRPTVDTVTEALSYLEIAKITLNDAKRVYMQQLTQKKNPQEMASKLVMLDETGDELNRTREKLSKQLKAFK